MNVTLFVPGLFAVFEEISPEDIDALQCASLSRILSRAKKQNCSSVDNEHWLYGQFSNSHTDAGSIPVAAITALQDGLDSQQDYLMRADPVYLYPDTHSLILQDPDQLKLSKDEVQSLADLIAPLFDDYGAEFITPHHSRWYLRFDSKIPDISCTSLYEAMAEPVNEYLPQGEDRRRWHTLFNEIQMLLNQSAVNRQRETRQLQPVNSLWFWGKGILSDKLQSSYGYCVGNDYLLPGLCKATHTPYQLLSKDKLQNLPGGKETLVVDERLQQAVRVNNPGQWLQSLQLIEQETIAPLIEGLEQSHYQSITLQDVGKVYRCNKQQLKAFWKPLRKLSAYYRHI